MRTRATVALAGLLLAGILAMAAPPARAGFAEGFAVAGSGGASLVMLGGVLTVPIMGIYVSRDEPCPPLFGTGLAFGIVNLALGGLLLGFAHVGEGSTDIVMYSVGGVLAAVGIVGIVLGIIGLARSPGRETGEAVEPLRLAGGVSFGL